MKKLYTLSAILITFLSFAQVPQGISYQAIALDASGNPVVSANVGIRLSILDATATGAVLYSESHIKTTNPQGLFNLVIGQGTTIFGIFNTINWGTNSKFLKVEMDANGGTSYALVGTTQLLSAPYALAADSLVTSPGEGITLVSPNGTPYQVTVNDSGQLSLPTSISSNTLPANLYCYGTFNSFNPTTSLQLRNLPTYPIAGGQISPLLGYKYLTSGTQLKFVTQNNDSAPKYGISGNNNIILNGDFYTVADSGFYLVQIDRVENGSSFFPNYMKFYFSSTVPLLTLNTTNFSPTYNVNTNTFSFVVNNVTSASNQFKFGLEMYSNFSLITTITFGDNLADGTTELGGANITFPNTTTTPKNYRVDLVLNFNGSGNYTITQIP